MLRGLDTQELGVFDGAVAPGCVGTARLLCTHQRSGRALLHFAGVAAFEGDEYYKVDVQARLEDETSVPATMYVWHARCVISARRSLGSSPACNLLHFACE